MAEINWGNTRGSDDSDWQESYAKTVRLNVMQGLKRPALKPQGKGYFNIVVKPQEDGEEG